MLDPRLYRVAFVPVLLALLVAAFSLQDRPRPIGTTLSPEAFDRIRAGQSLDALAKAFPSRRPGSEGDARLATYVAGQLRASVPGQVVEHRYRATTTDGKRDLVDVIATRPGVPGPGVVVVAHRDAAESDREHPARAELSATAALLELARVAADGRLRRTITFISTTGGSLGATGASEEAERLTETADAVIVLGPVGATTTRRPFVVPYSDGRGQAPVQLQATVQRAAQLELGSSPGAPRAAVQWLRMAVPATIGEQGAFLRNGQPAILLSPTGERPAARDAGVSEARMAGFGRAALRVLYALDNFRDYAKPPRDDLVIRGKVLPGWAVRLLVGTLLLPPLLMGIDALARLRRRHEPMGPWGVWALAGGVPFLLACAFARLLAAIGLIDAPGAPVPGANLDVGGAAIAALVALVLVFALGWLVARAALLHASGAARVVRREPDGPGATVAVGLLSVAVGAAIWVNNPYAAMLVVPAVHLWPWAMTPDLRWPRPAALALVLAALLPLALTWWVDARAFDLSPLTGVWFWTLLVAGGHVPLGSWVLWSLFWGCVVAAAMVAVRKRRPRDEDPEQITVRGPVTYAGPGSLGGTPSTTPRR